MRFIENNGHGGYKIEYLGRRFFIQLTRETTILKEFRDGLFQDLHTTPWRVSVDDLPLFLVRTIRSLKSGDVSEKQC